MAEYNLATKQMQILHRLAPQLDESADYKITFASNGVRCEAIYSDVRGRKSLWMGDITKTDFKALLRENFIISLGGIEYTFDVEKIIEAVTNNFQIPDSQDIELPEESSPPIDVLSHIGTHAAMNNQKITLTVTPMFGQPPQHTQYQADIFMIMPFTKELDPIYHDHVKRVAQKLKLSIKRANDFFSQQAIMLEIWGAINAAKIIIADCTGRNPNVFYEMGIAHTLGKPVIMITQNSDDIPFDIRHIRYIHYQYTPPGIKQFEKKLEETIKTI